MRIYLSGAMHGQKDQGERLFRLYAKLIMDRGHDPIVPSDIAAVHPNRHAPCPPAYSSGNGHSAACWMRGDLIELLGCDAILMVGQWHNSVGAEREHAVACWTGIQIYYAVEMVPNRSGFSPPVASLDRLAAAAKEPIAEDVTEDADALDRESLLQYLERKWSLDSVKNDPLPHVGWVLDELEKCGYLKFRKDTT